MEVVLSTEEPKTQTEGTQDKMDEQLRGEIQKIMDDRKTDRQKEGTRGGFKDNRRGGTFRENRGVPKREGEEKIEEEDSK